MARPSKLTDKQWEEIERRHIKGESIRSLAREFKVSESTIRDRISAQCAEIKAVANQIITAEERFSALPVSAQVSARSLVDDLKAISGHLASAAKFGSMTAHRLSVIAHAQTDLIDEAASFGENAAALQSVMAMTKGANEAATIGINLLRANKETVDGLNNQAAARAPSGLSHFYGDTDTEGDA
jgi:hypothetical protein